MASATGKTTTRPNSAIYGPIPRQRKFFEGDRYKPPKEEWDDSIPYGGKIYLARKKKPDSWTTTILEVCAIAFVVGFCYCSYYYLDHMHFKSMHAIAYFGYPNSAHFVGQRYLEGRGVERHPGKAMEWFKVAADQGHPHASHNLAVGHLKGYHKLPLGKAHELIQHAARHGVHEAQDALNTVCIDGGCM